jgi:hypothetical protein
VVQASLQKKQDLVATIIRTKRAGGMVEAIESLPLKHEAELKPQYHQKCKKSLENPVSFWAEM